MWSRLVCGLWLAAQTQALETARVGILLFNIFGVCVWGCLQAGDPGWLCQADAGGSMELPARSGPRWGKIEAAAPGDR